MEPSNRLESTRSNWCQFTPTWRVKVIWSMCRWYSSLCQGNMGRITRKYMHVISWSIITVLLLKCIKCINLVFFYNLYISCTFRGLQGNPWLAAIASRSSTLHSWLWRGIWKGLGLVFPDEGSKAVFSNGPRQVLERLPDLGFQGNMQSIHLKSSYLYCWKY